jgi:23S rRNA (uracil1939-C5)-methyltransferase
MARGRHQGRRASVEGVARDLDRRGEARVETPRGPVRVAFVLPGERVAVDRLERAGGRWHGRLAAVLEPSPERRPPACPLFARCGGCGLMAMSLEAQGAHRRERVRGALSGLVGPSSEVGVEPVVVPGASDLAYRRRARMSYRRTSGGVVLGYRGHRSHHIVDVDQCAVLAPALGSALAAARDGLVQALQGTGELRLHLGAGQLAALVLDAAHAQPPAVYAAAERLAATGPVAGVALRVAGTTAAAQWGDPREHVPGWDGEPLVGPPGGFAQANDAVSRALVGRVRELAAPEGQRVLELFAGHGTLTVALAPGARAVIAVERDPAAADACRENLVRRQLPARVICGEAAEAIPKGPVDVAVLDPPREGAAAVLGPLLARRPERIVYVSCEPTTLGRDLATLVEGGYEVDRALAFDMFPHTAHVEAVVRLRRRP